MTVEEFDKLKEELAKIFDNGRRLRVGGNGRRATCNNAAQG